MALVQKKINTEGNIPQPELSPFKYLAGSHVKDKITGFEGVITCRCHWMFGCIRYDVTPMELDKDGQPQKSNGFDEDQLVLVETEPIEAKKEFTGGPRDNPSCYRR